jgi:hypothetical protein
VDVAQGDGLEYEQVEGARQQIGMVRHDVSYVN